MPKSFANFRLIWVGGTHDFARVHHPHYIRFLYLWWRPCGCKQQHFKQYDIDYAKMNHFRWCCESIYLVVVNIGRRTSLLLQFLKRRIYPIFSGSLKLSEANWHGVKLMLYVQVTTVKLTRNGGKTCFFVHLSIFRWEESKLQNSKMLLIICLEKCNWTSITKRIAVMFHDAKYSLIAWIRKKITTTSIMPHTNKLVDHFAYFKF